MAGLPRPLARKLGLLIASYVLLAILMLLWNFVTVQTLDEPTIGLLFVYGIATTLVGLLLIWFSVGVLTWTHRTCGLFLMTVFLVVVWASDRFLLWQMLRVHAAQAGFMAIAFATFHSLSWDFRYRGVAVTSIRSKIIGTSGSQVIILCVFAACMAISCGSLLLQPEFRSLLVLLAVLAAGGCAAGAISLAAMQISLGQSSWPIRILMFAIVAPMGGIVYALATIFVPLLFNFYWFAGVTTLQTALTVLPLAIARRHGFEFTRTESESETLGHQQLNA